MARVEARSEDGGWQPALADGMPVDDQGQRMGVVQLAAPRGAASRYAVRWYTGYLGPSRPHRFVLLGGGAPGGVDTRAPEPRPRRSRDPRFPRRAAPGAREGSGTLRAPDEIRDAPGQRLGQSLTWPRQRGTLYPRLSAASLAGA